MILRIADDRHAPAVRSYHGPLRNCFFGVVSAFRVDVGLERKQKLFDGWVVEDGDVGYRFQRCNDLCAFGSGQYRTAGAFKIGDLLVRIYAHHEHVAQRTRAGKITNVSDVKHVETPVRENYSRT